MCTPGCCGGGSPSSSATRSYAALSPYCVSPAASHDTCCLPMRTQSAGCQLRQPCRAPTSCMLCPPPGIRSKHNRSLAGLWRCCRCDRRAALQGVSAAASGRRSPSWQAVAVPTFEVAPVDAGALPDDAGTGAHGGPGAAALPPLPPRPVCQTVGVQVWVACKCSNVSILWSAQEA